MRYELQDGLHVFSARGELIITFYFHRTHLLKSHYVYKTFFFPYAPASSQLCMAVAEASAAAEDNKSLNYNQKYLE